MKAWGYEPLFENSSFPIEYLDSMAKGNGNHRYSPYPSVSLGNVVHIFVEERFSSPIQRTLLVRFARLFGAVLPVFSGSFSLVWR